MHFGWILCTSSTHSGRRTGSWVLRGTRMSVATIFENLEAGTSFGDVLGCFDGLNREQVKVAIDFAARPLRRLLLDQGRPVPLRLFLYHERDSRVGMKSEGRSFVLATSLKEPHYEKSYRAWRSVFQS
jgi:uncharacterized protein (DUF433 family)